MSKPLRFAPTMSAIALASVIAGCAAPQSSVRTSQGAKDGTPQIGMAMRAMGALEANDFASAVLFGEQAVANSPNDAAVRILLGNAYFGSGRFASAETAYRDALSLDSNQPQAVLKLALVQIAQGKNAQALSYLNQARNVLQPADYGLAVALAGQPQEAVNVLDAAAREAGADARVRQNLAFAYALSGDWTAARNVASQDLSADLVDARIQQWMALAKPKAAYEQVAALTGFKPVAVDPGQPTRLALRGTSTRVAEVAAPAPAAVVAQAAAALAPQPQQPVAQYVPAPEQTDRPVVEYVPEYEAPAQQAAAPQAAEPAPVRAPAPAVVAEVLAPAPEPQSASRIVAAVVEAVAEAPAAIAEYVGFVPKAEPKKKAPPARALLRRASFQRATGNANAVLQLGAYGSPSRVEAAWNSASRRYSALRAYSPVSAKFQSPKGLVYRLSVKGFGSADQAKDLCQSLRRAGGECFVRSVAGDAPVRLASR
jgi:D-alanyl-D-alanine carboxypeptidase